MDLRFDCRDLAEVGVGLESARRAMSRTAEELSGVFASMDAQLKSYEGLTGMFARSNAAIQGLAGRLADASRSLSEILEAYQEAERDANRIAEDLPAAAAAPPSGAPRPWAASPMPIAESAAVSPVANSDLVLEDWLRGLALGGRGDAEGGGADGLGGPGDPSAAPEAGSENQ